jgi:hypothetical protein
VRLHCAADKLPERVIDDGGRRDEAESLDSFEYSFHRVAPPQ